VSKTTRRVIIGLASVVVLAIAASVFWWWRFEPRCDPAPLEALGRELAERPVEESIMRRADVDAAVEAACPRVPFEYWRIARPEPNWEPTSRVNPKAAPRWRVGRRLPLDCGPEGHAAADAEPEAWRECADAVGHPRTLRPDRNMLRSQLFFEREGVSREAAQALVWTLVNGWSDVATPVVHAWTAIERPRAEVEIEGEGYAGIRVNAITPDGFAIAGRLPMSTFTGYPALELERREPVQYLRALSIAHGQAFPQWVWLPIELDGFAGARAPCVDSEGHVGCEGPLQTAVELGPGRLWLAREHHRVELAWKHHDEFVAALRDDDRLAWARAQPAWVAVTDPDAVEWRSFLALVDFFAPTTCVASLDPEALDPACAQPFALLFLGETITRPP
jgi:hypothetical protein